MGVEIVPRREWGLPVQPYMPCLQLPVHYVVVAFVKKNYSLPKSKRSPGPRPSRKECIEEIKYIHQGDISKNADIRFNFLVSPDGTAFEGLGWSIKPYLPTKYRAIRNLTLFIGYIGDYSAEDPSEELFKTKDELVKMGVQREIINPRFMEVTLANPWKHEIYKGPKSQPSLRG